MKIRRAVSAMFAVPIGLSLAACGGSTSGPIVAGIPGVNAQLRFINGAPSAGTLSWSVDGTTQGGSFQPSVQAGISSYITTAAKTHTVTFAQSSGATINLPNGCNTGSLGNNTRTTIVLVGNGGSVPYQCIVFNEPGVNGSQPSVVFHHAATVAVASNSALATVYAGYQQPAGTGAVTNLGAFQNPISLPPGPPVQFTNITPAASTSGGISFSISGSAGAAPIATLRPSQVDTANTGNIMPFTGGSSTSGSNNSDYNLAVYALDAPSGTNAVTLVGSFSP